ncbi:hypothetical protein CVT24_012901 [Panaeolus cyanescens]|uniref:endo-1,4-beta-xylanase n=1 Tax=Panaeolus cyanescens TaxID=181874 RepID=A0A409W2S0_9AGAR|nr:hypothetical protein CVT24_012901 [Panaeolus cyanescens]
MRIQLSTPLILFSTLIHTCVIVLASHDQQLAARQSPITLAPSGPYFFTDNVSDCISGPDNTVNFGWNVTGSMTYTICGVGWKTGTNGTITYAGTYFPSGNGIYGIYGWTRDPLVEYRVVESFGILNPASAARTKGNTMCNGFIYDVYEATRYDQPGIDGDLQTFQQNWSVKRAKRIGQGLTGSVDMDCHFKAWASFGMKLGTLDYQLISSDAYFSGGTATMTIVLATPPVSITPVGQFIFTDGLSGCTNGSGGSFSAVWGTASAPEPTPFCGKGWSIGSNRTIHYEGRYFPNGESKLFVYGWTRSPLVEYYVMESFGVYKPPSDAEHMGSVTCNGQEYDVLRTWRYNQPSIDGTQTFQQFWSARKGIIRGPISGEVDMGCHFDGWKALGMTLGDQSYQLVAVDAYYSSGSASITIS